MSIDIREYVSLARLTTIMVGGHARYYTRPHDDDDLVHAIQWAHDRSLPWYILGGGSNVVFSDAGFDGLIIHNHIAGVDIHEHDDDTVEVVAGAGENWDDLVTCCVDRGWQGIECLAGIPGSVGATPIQNVGAYGQEVSQCLRWVEAYDTQARWTVRFTAAQGDFAYRSSRFKHADRGRYVITRVAFTLRRNAPPTVAYKELAQYLAEHDVTAPTPQDVRRAVLDIRRTKSAVVDEHDPLSRSCGSFFTNPHMTVEQHATLTESARRDGIIGPDEQIPAFPVADSSVAGSTMVKVPAAWLIEHAGIERGYRMGGAAISPKHALIIINADSAIAADIAALATLVSKLVLDCFGISLQVEPDLVGLPAIP